MVGVSVVPLAVIEGAVDMEVTPVMVQKLALMEVTVVVPAPEQNVKPPARVTAPGAAGMGFTVTI